MYNLIVRFLVVIIAICTAWVMYYRILRPHVFEPLAFVETATAVEIVYFVHNNTALINVIPTGVWIWYNGKDAYVYNQSGGMKCEGKDFEPAYMVDVTTGLPHSYNCVKKLSVLLDGYKGNKDKPLYIFIRPDNPSEYGSEDVLNLFFTRRIIN